MSLDQRPRRRKKEARRGPFVAFVMMAGSGYFELACGLVRWIFVLRLLGPTGRGLIGIVQVAERYLSNIHLGALHGITKRLPQALGHADETSAQRIEDVGSTWMLLTATVGAIAIVLAALLYPRIAPQTRLILCIGASVYLCDQTYTLYRTIGRCWQVYQPLLAGSVVLSLGLTSLMILGAWLARAVGATLGWLVSAACAVLTLHWFMDLRVRPRLNKETLRDLIFTGIPLAAMAFGDTLLVTLDGTLLLRLNATVLGLYMGVAMQARRYLFNLARAITFVLTPHLLEEFARHGRIDRLRQSVLGAARAAALAVPVLALATAVVLPPAVRTLVPAFYPAVPAGQITSFSTCLMIVPLAFGAALVALDREWDSVIGQLAGAAVIALLAWSPAGRADLVAVAGAAAVGTWVASVAVSAVALRRLSVGVMGTVYELISLQLPLSWAIGAFLISDRSVAMLWHLPDDTWLGGLARLAVGLLLVGPMAVVAERRYRVLKRWRGRAGATDELPVDDELSGGH